ncbi:hypothetical protein HL653_11210 [Sphingomonas sp. AP4-R1]|uniref:hypothetical protein n=1 Tax=Sphingomonas sp. AP4-R1 TaxID=2735134 RepID=UPI0014932BB0|nr:hypothetical protein [Sphingomonas sp. AP4-R1]QJU58277.1 hypothetical protein HL653_11210 [Sphingomonas sp. AP4-R1]
MPYPVDQLAALAKANVGLMLKLAEVARKGGEESLEVGNRAAGRFSEEARASIARATDKPSDAGAVSTAGPRALFEDMATVREHMIAGTRSAFQEWQQAWQDVASAPTAPALDAFAAMVGPWFGQKSPGDGEKQGGSRP